MVQSRRAPAGRPPISSARAAAAARRALRGDGSATNSAQASLKSGSAVSKPQRSQDLGSVGSAGSLDNRVSLHSDDLVDNHMLFRGVCQGEEGVLAIVDFLWSRFRLEPRLRKYISQCRVSKLAVRLRAFLELSFVGRSEWPPLQIEREDMTRRTKDVLESLCEVIAKPLPLGEDILDCSVAILASQAKNDERVMRFFLVLAVM